MYDKRPENEKAIERAWAATAELGRGDVLEHERAEAIFGVARPDPRYYALIDRLKRRLEEDRGIAMRAIPLVGYELTPVKDQLELARFRATQAARRLRKGARHAGSLPEADCSFTELRAKQAIEERLHQSERSIRGEAQRLAFLMRPRDQRPRIARGDDEAMTPA